MEKTEATKQKREFILKVLIELADFFSIKLTDVSTTAWIDELMVYSEVRILKTKNLLRSSHRGYLYPSHFHEAITAFEKEKQPELVQDIKPIPMPDSFKKKYLKLKKGWDK